VSAHAPSTGETDRDIAVAVLIADRALLDKVIHGLSTTHGLVLVEDAEADVLVSDGVPAENRPAVVLVADEGIREYARSGLTVLPASISAATLRVAIEAVLHGLICAAPSADRDRAGASGAFGEGFDDPYGSATGAILTERELEVLQLMAAGAPNKAIARHLDISVHTAKFHVGSILEKLDAASRADAVARGMRLGLVML
jgi:DNA-binding NarL/FixJ family response regulator